MNHFIFITTTTNIFNSIIDFCWNWTHQNFIFLSLKKIEFNSSLLFIIIQQQRDKTKTKPEYIRNFWRRIILFEKRIEKNQIEWKKTFESNVYSCAHAFFSYINSNHHHHHQPIYIRPKWSSIRMWPVLCRLEIVEYIPILFVDLLIFFFCPFIYKK